jgi:transcriptional regulator with XRE-family HTH domain
VFSTEENIRLIFGLKVKQLRTEKGLQQTDLARLTGFSVSYINEIEKGKKFPKPDKILIMAKFLDADYNDLVSLKMDKNLSPISQILESPIMQEVPLKLFGIDKGKLIELISKAPAKINAFISTLIEIARNYNLTQEHFYFASLRSYQEMHDNYFEDLEQEADKFAISHPELLERPIQSGTLKGILEREFAYQIESLKVEPNSVMTSIRSVFLPETRTLLINEQLADTQKAFIYGKEIGYCQLKLSERAFTTPWQKAVSFDQVLSNMMASYFAGALLIPKAQLISDLHLFFNNAEWRPELFLRFMEKYNSSPEMFMHRLTNIIPAHFGLKNLFFLRFNYTSGQNNFDLTKELHLTQLHNPHANQNAEHYCRRWLAIRQFSVLEEQRQLGTYLAPVVGVQRSHFEHSANEYFNITLARWLGRTPDKALSVTIGFLINDEFKRKVRFWNSPQVPVKTVNQTCQRCGILNCRERVSEPTVLQEQKRLLDLEQGIAELKAGR